MAGPLRFLWNTRLIGTYLRFRVAVFLAGLIAVVGAIVALSIGGIWGILGLMAMVAAAFVVLGIAAATR